MGVTYSIFEDIPPSITFLNNQKQHITMETRIIVFYLDNFTDSGEKNTRLHSKYRNLIYAFKNRGFIVLTVMRNIDKILTDPANGLIGAILARIDKIQLDYLKRNIKIDIPSITFMSCGKSCANMFRAFDTTDYVKNNPEIYQKMISDRRSATSEGVDNSNLLKRSELLERIDSIVLINPTMESIKLLPKTTNVEKEVRVIYTQDHEIGKKTALSIIQKMCHKLIGDRIDKIKTADLTLNFRRNIGQSERQSQKIEPMTSHIVNGIYDAIDRAQVK
jgi:hypothetical protein